MLNLPNWVKIAILPGGIAVAVLLLALVFIHPTSKTAELVTKSAPAIVNTAVSAQARDDKEAATVKEIVTHVQTTTHSQVGADDTGRAGLVGLCSLAAYDKDPVCKLYGPDTGQLQKSGDASAATKR